MKIRSARDLAAAAFGERRVLVLQDERAIWTLWRGGRCIEERVESLDATVPNGCPWPAAGETFVDVVADSPHDDIERVLVASSDGIGRGPLASLRRRLLQARLARRHPEALVRMAPPALAPLVATLLRTGLPDAWREHLQALERGTLTVRTLHPALALSCASGEACDGDVLRIVRDGDTERHLLYRSGCPTFTRVVTTDDSDTAEAALAETLAHLAARHGVAAPHVLYVEAADEASRLARRALGTPGGRSASTDRLEKWRAHAMLRRLQLSTVLTALIAFATFATAVVHGLDSARQRARAAAAGDALALRVDTLAASVTERHATPVLAAASLAFVEAHERTGAPEADTVLRLLAEVLTAHPGVRLDRLAWSVQAAQTEIEDAPFARAASLPLRRGAVGEEEAPLGVLIEIAGRIRATGADAGAVGDGVDAADRVAVGTRDERSADVPVGERQRRFEAFVEDLERRDGVARLNVRLSPAAAASRDGETDAAPSLDYELRLRYARSG